MIIKEHKVLPTGLHCLIDDKGHVHCVHRERVYHNINSESMVEENEI